MRQSPDKHLTVLTGAIVMINYSFVTQCKNIHLFLQLKNKGFAAFKLSYNMLRYDTLRFIDPMQRKFTFYSRKHVYKFKTEQDRQ